MRHATRATGALAVAAIAFGLYFTTLLPGQDLGDTASFQSIAGERVLTPRQGYPLYFAIAGLFVKAMPDNPAKATNLACAVEAALATGVFVLVGAELGGSIVAGIVAGLLLAASYTFWSQAVIAEVYALHALIVGLCLLTLLWWASRPSLGRLAVFFAIYALGFGNHLQMALLMPACALFILASAPEGPLSVVRPRVVFTAAGLAALFALQYAWNLSTFYFEPDHPPFTALLRSFWFDVTKSDWRANMVVTIPWSMIGDRFAMYWFDLRQQVGLAGIAAAAGGLVFLLLVHWRRGMLVAAGFAVAWAFAFTYNVGDVHVFFLSSHFFVCLAAGCGAGWLYHGARSHLGKRAATGRPSPLALAAVAVLLAAYPAYRAWDTYPAMDRSRDLSPTRFLDSLTAGLTGEHEIFARDLMWQLHNGLDYYAKYTKPDLPVLDVQSSLLYLPLIVWDNAAMGRDVVLTEGAATQLRSAFGSLLPIERDERLPVVRLDARVAGLRAGTPYVLAIMDSYPETPLDPGEMEAVATRLGLRRGLPRGRYVVVAGRVGEPPVLQQAADMPFRARTRLDGRTVDVRIECWIPADTIRRMGFGHVVVGRRHVLALDRGASFVALGPDGSPVLTAWAGGIYQPQARYVIRHAAARP